MTCEGCGRTLPLRRCDCGRRLCRACRRAFVEGDPGPVCVPCGLDVRRKLARCGVPPAESGVLIEPAWTMVA